MGTTIKTDIIIAIIISAIAAMVGLVTNTIRTPVLLGMVKNGKMEPATANYYRGVNLIDDWSHDGWPWKPKDKEGEIKEIYFDEARAIFESGEATFVDARVLKEYNKGHIEGAIPWPFNEFVEYLEKYQDRYPFDTPLVVYCEGGNCDLSYSVAESLLVSGFTDISLYLGGFDEWQVMEQPIGTGGIDG